MCQAKLRYKGQTVYNFVWPPKAMSVAQFGKVKETIVIVEKIIHDYFLLVRYNEDKYFQQDLVHFPTS